MSTTRWPASTKSRLRSAWVASVEPLPGSERPRASVRQFIEFAVNMPEQEPQVGQAERSMICTSSSEMRSSPAATMASTRSMARCLPLQHDLAGLHRPAGDEDGGNVEPHGGHQHAGRDLVAVRDAHHRIGAVRVDHVLDGVGDELARGQRVEHAVMAHGDAVIDGDRVEFLGDAARRLDLPRDELARGPSGGRGPGRTG